MSKTNHEQPPRFRWLVLLFAALTYIDAQMTFLSVAPGIPQIARSLHVDAGAATILLMSSFLSAGCVTWIFLGGYLSDRFGVFFTLNLSLICLVLPAALTPWIGSSTTGVFLARASEGLSVGLMFPTLPAIQRNFFPPHQRGLANGLLNASVAVGNSAGVFMGPLVLGLVGDWKRMPAVLSLFGWVSLGLGLVLYFGCNSRLPKHEELPVEAGGGSAFRRELLTPFTFLGIATSFMAAWGLLCLLSLTSTYLAAAPPLGVGYGAMMAGRLTLGATLLGGVLGPTLSGFLLDKVFHGRAKWVLYIGFSFLAVCMCLLKSPAVVGNIPLLEAVLIVAGIAGMFTLPTMYYLTACSYSPQVVGKMSGLWSGIGNCGGVLGLYIAGVTIKAQNTYRTSFTLQASIAVLGLVLTALLIRARKRSRIASAATAAV